MLDQIKFWITSSTGEGLSLRVKSFLVSIIPIIILVAHLSGYSITSENINSLIEQITVVISSVVTIISAIGYIYGQLRAMQYKHMQIGKFTPDTTPLDQDSFNK